MNFFDLIFTILILIFLVLGFSKGSFRELLSTIGIVIGYVGAEQFHERYLGITLQYIQNYAQAKVITYLAIFAVGLVIGFILSTLVRLMSSSQRPSFPSRILAGFLGLLKGVLICLAIYFVVEGYIPSYMDDLYNSAYTPWLQHFRKLINGINFALIQNILA
ncbi:CvpA family protein [bacterium]|nr:CvpA family protein [bacterium]